MTNSKKEGNTLTEAQSAILNYFENECDHDSIQQALYTLLFLTNEDAVNHDFLNGPVYELWRMHELCVAL